MQKYCQIVLISSIYSLLAGFQMAENDPTKTNFLFRSEKGLSIQKNRIIRQIAIKTISLVKIGLLGVGSTMVKVDERKVR
jgi:hypothetical protein